jgi:hypothetical protein
MPPFKTDYPNLRENLHPDFAKRSDKAIEAAFERYGSDAEAAEGFFSDLGKFVQKAAPAILPVAGTVVGGAFGGPIGASLGGSLASFAGKAIGGGGGQASSPSAGGLGGLLGGGGLGNLLGGSSAASQLLQTVLKPQTMQAVASMAMGPLGKPNVSVGGTQVPVGAFGNLLKILSGRMEAEYNAKIAEARSDVPEYMKDYAGEPKGDPAVADNRARALFELLESTESEQEAAEGAEAAESAEYAPFQSELEALQAEYDAIELMEAYESEEA